MLTESLPWPLYNLFHVEDEPSSPTGIKNEVVNLLRHYETPGVFPPHSRIHPNLKRLEQRPISIWEVCAIVAYKGEPFVPIPAQVHGALRSARNVHARVKDLTLVQLPKLQEMRSLIRSGAPARNHGEFK